MHVKDSVDLKDGTDVCSYAVHDEQLMIMATLKQHNATITQQAAVININNCSLLGYGSKLRTERQWLEQDINQIQRGEWEKSQKNPSDLERSLMLN